MLLEINSTRADISPSESREIRDVVINALKDPAPAVRRAYVGAVGRLGKPDLIPALEDIADFDSYSEPPNTDHFPVREAAQEAIQAIQQRAKAQ